MENATAAAGAMCVIDWKRTAGSPIECSRRCSKVRPAGASVRVAIKRASSAVFVLEALFQTAGGAEVKSARAQRGRRAQPDE